MRNNNKGSILYARPKFTMIKTGIVNRRNTPVRTGFTILELLVVLTIISLLFSITFALLSGSRAKSRDAKRLRDVKELQKALELRYNSYNDYPRSPPPGPPSWSDSCSNTSDYIFHLTQNEDYISVLPIDPLNSDSSCYRYRGSGQDFKIAVYMERPENQEAYSGNDGGVRDDWYEVFTPGAQSWDW